MRLHELFVPYRRSPIGSAPPGAAAEVVSIDRTSVRRKREFWSPRRRLSVVAYLLVIMTYFTSPVLANYPPMQPVNLDGDKTTEACRALETNLAIASHEKDDYDAYVQESKTGEANIAYDSVVHFLDIGIKRGSACNYKPYLLTEWSYQFFREQHEFETESDRDVKRIRVDSMKSALGMMRSYGYASKYPDDYEDKMRIVHNAVTAYPQ